MSKVILEQKEDTERYVKSGDIVIYNDDSKWLIIRLENSDFILYNLGTYKYMTLDKDYIGFELNGGLNPIPKYKQITKTKLSNATSVRLDIVNKKIGSRYFDSKEMKSKVLRGEDLTIKLVLPIEI